MGIIIRAIFGILMLVIPATLAIMAVSGNLFSRRKKDENGSYMGYRKFGFENKHYDNKRYHSNREDDRLKYARERFDRELRNVRDYERSKKRKFSRIDNAWRLVSVGAGLLTGGFLLDVNAPAAIGLGILVGGAVGWIGAIINNFIARYEKAPDNAMPVPQKPEFQIPQVQTEGMQAGKTEFVTKILQEGHENIKALETAMIGLRHPQSIGSVTQIIEIGRRLMREIAENPEHANSVQRLFTYYAKEAAKVVEGLGKIEGEKNPDIQRIMATHNILQKIQVLFESTEIELRQDENKSLDIDLKLLDQSLQSDLRIKQ